MKTRKISKRSGGFRTVAVPTEIDKNMLRGWLPRLHTLAVMRDVHSVQHGFMVGRSPVTNALAHVGYEYTVSFDLKDCFEHVKIEHLEGVIGEKQFFHNWGDLHRYAFINGFAMQGLPTSPIIANITLADLDCDIVDRLAGNGAYTRYADDLTISTNSFDVVKDMMDWIPQVVKTHEHEVNAKKTECQWSRNGRRIITGVGVDDKGIYPTRDTKRRLRATRHLGVEFVARGLEEWASLKQPSQIKYAADAIASDNTDMQVLGYFLGTKIGRSS
jgi:hypothetical protein